MRFVLAVDAGGSKTEAALSDAAGRVLARGRAGPGNLYRAPDAAIAAFGEVWAACCAEAGLHPAIARETTVSAALAGASVAAGRDRFHAATTGFARVLLSTDAYAAVIGAFEGRPGVMLSVGTGTVACRLDADGFTRIGGWGFPAGDLGGGAWIGLQLMSCWLERLDGLRGDDPVWRAVEAQLGTERTAILAWLRAATPGDFAGLAPLVLGTPGSAVAAGILAAAAAHLAALVRALGTGPVAMGGGLATAFAAAVGGLLGCEVALRPGAALIGTQLIAQGVFPAEF